jgi:hypothetical protein
MDYDSVMDRIGAGFLQGIVVAFVGLAAFLPASYVMNRYIYHKPAMRLFMGFMAALAGVGALTILLLLRLYNGGSMMIHYFGMLPALPEASPVTSDVKPTWLDWIGVGALQLLGEPLTFYYAGDKKDQDGYAATINTLLENFNTGDLEGPITGLPAGVIVHKNAVSEDLFRAGRGFGEMTTKLSPDTLGNFIRGSYTPERYEGVSISTASTIGKALFSSS